jgi:3-dehydroquinate synthase
MISEIQVSLGNRGYTVLIGAGISSLGEAVLKVAGRDHAGGKQRKQGLIVQRVSKMRSEKVAVITHPRIARLYGDTACVSLKRAGFSPILYQFPEGEQNKTLEQVSRIYDFLIQNRFERSSRLVALGGGVVGDMVGFTAATFLRGISYIQCPTTVVSQVDAAIGGKTGVDHPLGKNLIGAFHQPSLVLADPSTLMTLPKREFVAGLAEVVKYGVIGDLELFSFMESNIDAILKRDKESLLYCIKRSVEMKAKIVSADEKEGGLRKVLNYGHTFGHAIETLTGYRAYKHGEAVSIGMVAAAKAACLLGIAPVEIVSRLKAVLERFGLPTNFPNLGSADIMKVLASDKKVISGEIYFVLPTMIGKVSVQKIERKKLVSILDNICLN